MKGVLTPPLSWSHPGYPGSPPELKSTDANQTLQRPIVSHTAAPRMGSGYSRVGVQDTEPTYFSKAKSGRCKWCAEGAPVSAGWVTHSGYPEHRGGRGQLSLPPVVSSQEDLAVPGGMAHLPQPQLFSISKQIKKKEKALQ